MSTDQLVGILMQAAVLASVAALIVPRFCKPRIATILAAVLALGATVCFFVADAYTKPSQDVPIGGLVFLLLIVPAWLLFGVRVLEEPAQRSRVAWGVRALLRFVGGLLAALGLGALLFFAFIYVLA